MSKIEVNEIVPQSGTTLTLGGSGDTLSIASGVSSSFPSLTVSGDLTVDTNTLYVDSANNRVGIGTTSPEFPLDIQSDTNANAIQFIGRASDNISQITFTSNDKLTDYLDIQAGDSEIDFQGRGSIPMLFKTNLSEAMRIDSSGNVMIGKTSLDTGVAGFQTYATGAIVSTRASDVCIIAKRLNNDGSNIETFRDGSRTGYIGSNSGSIYIANGSNTAHKGLRFTGTQLKPCTYTGANDDGNYDLGSSTTRFKDAYLSGNLYIGGTGSANALDDYEEGSFTPTYSTEGGGESITYDSITTGKYVKIGQLVFVTGYIRTDGWSGGASYVYLDSLPFTINSDFADSGHIGFARANNFTGESPLNGEVVPNTTKMFLKFRSSVTGDHDNTVVSDINTGTNKNVILFSGTYRTS